MKNIPVLIILLAFFKQISFSQNIEYSLLKASVESDYFLKEFAFCKYDSTIIIFDKNSFSKTYKDFHLCGKKVIISNDTVYNKINHESYNLNKKYPFLIVLYNFKKSGNKYTLYFWKPYSGAVLIQTYKVKRKKIKLIENLVGSF